MKTTLITLRILFVSVCALAGWLICLSIKEWDPYQGLAVLIGILIGLFVVLIDVLLKGFSLRGLSVLTFGLFVGSIIAYMISISPLLDEGDPQVLYLVRLGLFIICSYLGAVIALRGKDEFNLIIPYVRFVPHDVDVPLVVLDTSALIDGRIVRVCEAQFITAALVIPQFVLEDLHHIADSRDPARQAKGRRGLESLNALRKVPNIDLRIPDSELGKTQSADEKLIFIAQSMKAKLLTTDFNLAKLAQFHGVVWLNLNGLSKALHPEVVTGERLTVDLLKAGREEGQAVGYLSDGSMVVVQDAHTYVGHKVEAEINSVVPTSGGKIVFCRMVGTAERDAVAS